MGSPINPDVTFDDLCDDDDNQVEMKLRATEFVRGAAIFLTLFGANGNGKTTALFAITNELLERNRPAVYVTASDLIDFIKRGIKNNDFSVEARIDRLAGISWLCIDELSQPDMTPWVTDKVETIVDRRYRLSKRTAFALDRDPVKALSGRMVSRLRSGVYFHVTGGDMRPKIAHVEQAELFKKEAFDYE